MQGKIKAIPVKEVIKGMQVTYNDVVYVVVKCQSNSNDLIIRRINATNLVDITNLNINLKTLVVEYQDHTVWYESKPVIQIPLKHSQWQKAIDNKEVDSDKIIEFEEIDLFEKENTGYRTYSRSEMEAMGGSWCTIKYAKIIPKNKTQIDESKLTHMGSMNYILQVWGNSKTNEDVEVDQYQPRKNRIWRGSLSSREAKEQVQETMERMKIAIELMQDWLDGKIDRVYYWQYDDEDKKRRDESKIEDLQR